MEGYTDYYDNNADHDYCIYDAGKSWSDSDIGWETPWDKEGAIGFDDSEDDPLFTFRQDDSKDIEDEQEISVAITSLVKKWVKNADDNKGLIISAPNSVGNYIGSDAAADSDEIYAVFYSSEASDALRPTLVVEYDDSPILHSNIGSENAISIIGMKDQIKLDVPFDGESAVIVHSLQGQELHSELVQSNNVSLGTTFNAGVYVVTIKNGLKTYSQRVVLQ